MPIDLNLDLKNDRNLIEKYINLKHPLIEIMLRNLETGSQQVTNLDLEIIPGPYLAAQLSNKIFEWNLNDDQKFKRYLPGEKHAAWKTSIQETIRINTLERLTGFMIQNLRQYKNMLPKMHGTDYHGQIKAGDLKCFNVPTPMNQVLVMAAKLELKLIELSQTKLN